MPLWVIVGSYVDSSGKWARLPSFLLDEQVHGIVDEAHALLIAKQIIGGQCHVRALRCGMVGEGE